jgi:hypothetical protein
MRSDSDYKRCMDWGTVASMPPYFRLAGHSNDVNIVRIIRNETDEKVRKHRDISYKRRMIQRTVFWGYIGRGWIYIALQQFSLRPDSWT